MRLYLPGARVARLTALTRSLSFLANFHHCGKSLIQRGLFPQTVIVRTGLASAFSTQTATYGRRYFFAATIGNVSVTFTWKSAGQGVTLDSSFLSWIATFSARPTSYAAKPA